MIYLKINVNDDLTTSNSNSILPPLHLAAVCGHLVNSKYPKKNINTGNDFGETPLHLAAANGHLVNSKAQKKNINPGNNFGETPLHSAAARGHLENSKYCRQIQLNQVLNQ